MTLRHKRFRSTSLPLARGADLPPLKLSGTVLRETCKVSFQSGKTYQVNSIGEWYTSPLTNIPETTVFFLIRT